MPTTSRFVRYASKSAQYLVTVMSDNLPKARRLVLSAPLSASDGGAGGDYTVAVAAATSAARGVLKLTGLLGGTADAPDVRGARVLDGGTPQLLAYGEVQDGKVFARSGTAIVGVAVVPAAGGAMSGNLALGGNKVTGLADGTAMGDAATYGQVTAMLNGLDWQQSVLEKDITDPAGLSPAPKQRYLIFGTGAGAWTGHTSKIAEWNGSGWTLTQPNKGMTVHVEEEGVDFSFDGTNWVNIGASVAHGALLGRDANDAHTQYQLGSAKDQNGGYAGLDMNGLVVKPVKSVRVGGDPGSPGGGEIWINGPELKFRDSQGSPTTQILERTANRNVNNGYAGLGADGRIGASQAPVKATYAAGGNQALTPGDIGAVAPTRSVAPGAGLTGGGDLSNDRTLSIGAFCGLVSRDEDPADATWGNGELKVHAAIDIGDGGHLVPIAVRLPAAVNDDLETEVVFEFGDGSSNPVILANPATGATLDLDFATLSLALMGGIGQSAANNGRRVRKIILRTRNTTSNTVTNVNIGLFQVRAYAFPRGAGAPL